MRATLCYIDSCVDVEDDSEFMFLVYVMHKGRDSSGCFFGVHVLTEHHFLSIYSEPSQSGDSQ